MGQPDIDRHPDTRSILAVISFAERQQQVRDRVRGVMRNDEIPKSPETGIKPANGDKGSLGFYNWFAYEFWRFQFVQQEVGKLAQTAIEFPPMQKGASFNLAAVKEQIEKAIQSPAGK